MDGASGCSMPVRTILSDVCVDGILVCRLVHAEELPGARPSQLVLAGKWSVLRTDRLYRARHTFCCDLAARNGQETRQQSGGIAAKTQSTHK